MHSIHYRPLLLGAISIFLSGGVEDRQRPVTSQEATPLSYGLVIDTSGSLRSQIDHVIETGKFIVKNNRKGDETFLLRFVDRKTIQIVTDFTEDQSEIVDGLDGLFPGGGQTAVIDAMYASAQHLAQHTVKTGTNRQRVLILITDGEDRESRHKPDEVMILLRDNNIHVYVIGLVGQLKKDRGEKVYERAVEFLNVLAKETGGKAFFPKQWRN